TRVERSAGRMAEAFPTFVYAESGGGGIGMWTAEVSPICSLIQSLDTLDDLAGDRSYFLRGTSIEHNPSCTATHDGRYSWMDGLSSRRREFALSIIYQESPA